LAKTALEKLQAAIVAADAARLGVEIGNQEGQYPQENVGSLSSSIDAAQVVTQIENPTDEQLEEAVKVLGAAIKSFKGSLIKLEEKQPEVTHSVSLKGVVLKGTDSEKKGMHTIFAYGGAVTFREGIADVNVDLADKLISDGYAEEGKAKAGE
jgi:signal recognition particle subunit SEC65